MPSLGGGAVGLLGKLPSLSLSRAATMPNLGGGWTVAPAAFSFFGAEAPMTLGGVTAIAFWRWTKELWPII